MIRVIWVSKVHRKITGWWCSLCNREYLDEDVKHSKLVGGKPECPSCYKVMKRIVRKLGSGDWMSGKG